MYTLTIDAKTNCYVIDTNQMNNLQQNVATYFIFEKGTFDIRITGGRYSHSNSRTVGEPFVLLWTYGDNGSTFINKSTGFEVGATWTTLNGYNDSFKLEVKDRAILNALFFDFNNEDNSGSIDLIITSNKQFFNPVNLTVDSKRNCYILDENYLYTLKQSGSNLVELNPGNYRIKIRESNASYWSDGKKFNIEPWVLMLLKGGKFITKLTGIETDETWVSLNGLNDELVLEVKERTTLTGLFFDTYKEDNEGHIILTIEQIGETEINENGQHWENNISTSIEIEQEDVETRQENYTFDFTFRFEEEEFKKRWEEQLKQIDSSTKVPDKIDITLENKYWEQLEQLLFKSYEQHFKSLSIEVAKVKFSMDAYLQQVELSLRQNLQGWSDYHLERILEDKINVEISNKINQQINSYFDQNFEEKIRNHIGLIISNIVNKQEFSQYVSQQANHSFEQNIRNNINLITQNIVNENIELNQYVRQQFERNIRNNINLITQGMVNNNTEINQYIDQRLQYNINNNNVLINQIFENDQLAQKIQNIFIDNYQIHQKIESVVINSPEINNRILNFVVNSTEINNKISNLYRNVDIKIDNIRNEWNETFITLASQYVDELIAIIGNRESFNIQIANIINIKVDELLNQIWRIRNELTVFINNSDRNLYEWTLGELMVIKNCLTDRQALVEQLVTFSTELRVKLDNTNCVDINTFKRFKPLSFPQQLPGNR
ncbi:hypothetical protein [Anabaena sp. UHCC 0399]|uniref:hypothetical protein n=1 Tax=Anabaena sp. UHCC 0399 TaxID=3110238 RepID=UPI002B20DA73|nr:hypothetical protein [Anabaena sp. UHCC 0399]MEA5564816.1 hypothetical protein [Anabaena sp. UHCC 0399]